MRIGPLLFRKIFKPKPWGGRALARVAGKRLPPGEQIGESWELADHPRGVSVVAGGPLDGVSLRALMKRHSRELIGRCRRGERFPLMVKLLDARLRLSVQVHPDDRLARRLRLRDSGKSEAFHVLRSNSRSRVVCGLKSARDAERLVELARSGRIASRLLEVVPRPDETLLCLPGAVHSIGPAVVALEVEQNSDATLRIYDWGRDGLERRPRPTHLREAALAVGRNPPRVTRLRPRPCRRRGGILIERLAECGKFVMDRWRVPRAFVRKGERRFEILYVQRGVGALYNKDWPVIRLRRGMTVLIPACVEAYSIRPSRPLVLLRTAEPD